MKRSFPGLLFLVFVLGCATPSKESGVKLDQFQLASLSGEAIDMGQYDGKTVFINVWATWCKPCIQEMPTIAVAMEKLKDQEVVFLFASNEEVEAIEEFRDNRKFPFYYVSLKNLEGLPINALPATFIFDPQGKMRFGEEGFRDWSTPENLQLITQPIQP